MIVINGTIFILLIIIIVLYTVLYFKIKYYKNRYKKIEELTITALQEIACDYKVKVIKCSYGSIYMSSQRANIKNLLSNEGCFELDDNNNLRNLNTKMTDFDFDNGSLYLINFKVYGRLYLAYAENPLKCWIVVIRRARKENKKLFGVNNWYIK